MPTSYAMKSKHIPYMLLIMFMLILAIAALLYASVIADFELIMLTFALICIIAIIIIVISWYHKLTPKQKKFEDHRLQ